VLQAAYKLMYIWRPLSGGLYIKFPAGMKYLPNVNAGDSAGHEANVVGVTYGRYTGHMIIAPMQALLA
jgi:hypothetical protein